MFRLAFDPVYILPLPATHRFPMLKYELIPEQLLHEGSIDPCQLFSPEPVDTAIARLVHTDEYLEKVRALNLSEKEIRASGFPLSSGLIEREFIIAGGTLACCQYAFSDGISFNVAGGTHHAFADRPEGFCLLNDCAIAAAYLLAEMRARKILIVDLDVHQGNGTAKIFENDTRVFTFSMHAGHNFPLQKEKSSLDIALPDGIRDAEYLSLLDMHLHRIIQEEQPDFMFYVAGVDILQTDKLGRLGVSREGCCLRDRKVLEAAWQNSIPLVVTMGGGYSEKITDIVEAHCNTYRIAHQLYD